MALAPDLLQQAQQLLSVDVNGLSPVELNAHIGRFEQLRSRLDAVALGLLAGQEHSQSHRLDHAFNQANWLTAQTGTSQRAARSRVLLAQRMKSMPETVADFRAGVITEEHVRAMARCIANPRTRESFPWDEPRLLERARRTTADEFSNAVDDWIQKHDQDGAPSRDRFDDELHVRKDGDRVKVRGDLGLETGVPLMEAIDERTRQLAERDKKVVEANPEDPIATRPWSNRRAEALSELVGLGAASPGNPARRDPLFNVVTDPLTLARSRLQADSIHELEDGSVIPIGVLDVWKCGALMSRVVLDARKAVLELGRDERYANREQRRALAARDRGCAVPGCDRPPEVCDAHHIVFWDDLGPTDIDNLVLLCRYHHRCVHREWLAVEMVDGCPRFTSKFGDVAKGKYRSRPPTVLAA